jgi:hypothetical protein
LDLKAEEAALADEGMEEREEAMSKYAYRLETKRMKDPDFPYMGKNFTHPEAVAEFCRSL